jgi:hypothetical protein
MVPYSLRLVPSLSGVAQPVGADLLDGDPRQVFADALPQVVVAAAADGTAVSVAQDLAVGACVAAFVVVGDQGGRECRSTVVDTAETA